MSYYCFRNMGPYTSPNGAPLFMYDMKENLKSLGGTKNWSVVQSGDGIAAYSGTSDVITSGASGANGLNNNGAWFVLEDADSNRQILFQRHATQAYSFYAWYSKSKDFGNLVVGTATTRPTANDEETFMDNRTVGPESWGSSGTWYGHMAAEGDTPDGNVYPFWFVCRVQSTGTAKMAMILDCVVDSQSPVADSDKAVLMFTPNALYLASNAYLNQASTNSRLCSYMRYGEVEEEWSYLGLNTYSWSSGVFPTTYWPTNPENGQGVILPYYAIRAGASTNGIKGPLHMLKPLPGNYAEFGDVVYDGTLYHLVVNDVILPGWTDGTSPTV